MRFILAPLATLCLLFSTPVLAQGSADSIYVPGKGYVEPYQLTGHKQARHFGGYTKKYVAKKAKASRVAKTRTVKHADRTVFTYALNKQGDVTGFNSASASCLPQSVKAKLSEIERRFGKVKIISAFRKGARIAGSGHPSHHAACRAVDFNVARNQPAAARWLKQTHNGGVGTYSGRFNHIHIDNGRRARWHN
jgi:hypothetical protein